MNGWQYIGDIDLRHGGYYWREDGEDDYVLAVRVTPCSDAGGPDNLFQIESGSIYIGTDATRIASALDIIGATPDTATRAQIVDAMLAYRGIETDSETIVQIGKRDTDASANGWNPDADVILRGNAKLRRYVEREYLA